VKKWLLMLFAALSLSMAVTGCSGTEDEETDTGTDTEQNEDAGTESVEGTEEETE
jgi:hypothetical protein